MSASDAAEAGAIVFWVIALTLVRSRKAQAVVLATWERTGPRLRRLGRLLLPRGRGLLAVSVIAGLYAAATVVVAVLLGPGPLTAAYGGMTVVLALWCAVSVRALRSGSGWTDEDREWLEETGAALPEAEERRR